MNLGGYPKISAASLKDVLTIHTKGRIMNNVIMINTE
jgi:hypothetical protein